MKTIRTTIGLCVFLNVSLAFAQPTALEIAEYGNKAAQNRLQIKSWHVRVEREDFDVNREEELQKCLAVEYYVDGVKHRTDHTWTYKVPVEGRSDTYIDYMSEDGENHYAYSSEVLEDGTPVALTVVPLKQMSAVPEGITPSEMREIKAATAIVDIRALGFVSTGLNYKYGMNYARFVQNMEKKSDLQMEDNEINGVLCKKISYTYRDPPHTGKVAAYQRFWIAPEQGYSILRSETEPGDKSFFDRTNITVERHSKTGLWVPVESVFERSKVKDGERFVSWSERLKLEYLSLNERISDETFTPKTMNIPVGRAVHVTPPPNEPMFWDGNEVVGESAAAAPVPVRNYTIRYLLVAVGLALICASCLMKYFELRRKKREQSGD